MKKSKRKQLEEWRQYYHNHIEAYKRYRKNK